MKRIRFPGFVRQAFWALVLMAAYLGTGAAWKVWMVLRYPPSWEPLSTGIAVAMGPYSRLPVGYALGIRFGRLATALHLAGERRHQPQSKIEAAAIFRDLARSRGPWSDVAAFDLASIEQDLPRIRDPRGDDTAEMGSAAGSRTLVLYLDDQRWGRTTWPISPNVDAAAVAFRRIAEAYPGSPVASDALNSLADIEASRWEFQDASVCNLAAAIVSPGRADNLASLVFETSRERPEIAAAASAYALYLKGSGAQRQAMRAPLIDLAQKAGDGPLVSWLGTATGGSEGANSDDGPRVKVEWNGSACLGAHVALVDLSGLRSGMMADQAYRSKLLQQSKVNASTVAASIEAIIPARPDDLESLGSIALISPEQADRFVTHLPVRTSDPRGIARFPASSNGAAGVAILMDDSPRSRDACLSIRASDDRLVDVRLIPRVKLLPVRLSLSGPPVLSWQAYPGAVRYRVYVARETPGSAAQATALSPDWDRRVVWWNDSVKDPQIRLTPDLFVGPASNPELNGLWAGQVYRVIVVAEDAQGQILASSIGMKDHPEEFFTASSNWLGLNGPGVQIPSREAFGPSSARIGQRRHHRGFFNDLHLQTPSDPLEQILETARANDPTLIGAATTEPDLVPVSPGNPSAVHLQSWPSSTTDGQGLVPLQSPFQHLVQPSAGSLPGSESEPIPGLGIGMPW